MFRGDSWAALGALGRLRSASPWINAVARELAIDIAEARYELAVHQHVVGKLNVLPSSLPDFANLVLLEFPLLILKEFAGLGSTL